MQMSSPSLTRPSVPNTPLAAELLPSLAALAVLRMVWMWAAQGLRSAWSTGQGSPGWLGCSPHWTSPPAALERTLCQAVQPWSWLETRCRVKMRGPIWRTESSSYLLTCDEFHGPTTEITMHGGRAPCFPLPPSQQQSDMRRQTWPGTLKPYICLLLNAGGTELGQQQAVVWQELRFTGL